MLVSLLVGAGVRSRRAGDLPLLWDRRVHELQRSSTAALPCRYAEQKAIVAIESPAILEGMLSPRALGLVMEWAAAHRQELLDDWNLARQQQPLNRIAPLE